MFSFIKINNPNLRVFLIICLLFIIYVLIKSIIKLHMYPDRYKNIYEAFVSKGNYSSEKCEYSTRNLKEDDLYHKVKNLDIVYMWVDGSDKKWQSKMNSKVSSRNRSNDELVYSLRSISKFMPWHEGRIFIVTPNQTPSRLNTVQGISNSNQQNISNKTGKEVIIIDQNSIMPDEVGNTANSFIIEIFLHRIPTLSDNFIYMNDDYFIGQPLLPNDFFTLNKDGTLRPKFYSNNYQIKGGIEKANEFYDKKKKLWLSATYTTNGTLDNYFKSNNINNNMTNNYIPPKRYYLEHAPYMFNKSWCEEVYKMGK